jgi:WD40 repeat protein
MNRILAAALLIGVVVGATGQCFSQTPKLWATLEGHQEVVYAIAFSPDNWMLVSGGMDGFIKLWEVRTGNTQGKS